MLPTLVPTAVSADVHALLRGLRARRVRTQRDRALADRLYDLFEGPDAPRVDGLVFYVFEGSVSVYGAVRAESARDSVMAALSTVAGIGQIADHLTVGA